jgi:dTDP-4-dehydrorhamnose reductase
MDDYRRQVAYLITGAGGMLGRDLATVLADRDVTALSRRDLDITDAAAVDAAVAGHTVVLNAAAYTRVDDAETDEAAALAINGTAAGLLAEAAARHGGSHRSVLHRLRVRRLIDNAVRRGRPAASRLRLRTHQGGRRGARARGPPDRRVRHPHRLALRRPRSQLRQDDAALGCRAGDPGGRRRPGGPADVDDGSRTSHDRASRRGRAPRASTTAPTPVTAVGSTSLAPCSSKPDSTPSASIRPTVRHSCAPPRVPAYSVLGHSGWARAGLAPLRDWRDALIEAAAAERPIRHPDRGSGAGPVD